MPDFSEWMKTAAEFFAGTPWWPVIEATAALTVVAGLVRLIFGFFPGLPVLIGRAGVFVAINAAKAWKFATRSMKESITYKHAPEPRWVKPLSLAMELLIGGYLALLLYLYFLQFVLITLYGDAGLALWKRFATGAMALVTVFFAKMFTVQARDAWHQIKARRRANARSA